jgi:hypothetical protein
MTSNWSFRANFRSTNSLLQRALRYQIADLELKGLPCALEHVGRVFLARGKSLYTQISKSWSLKAYLELRSFISLG